MVWSGIRSLTPDQPCDTCGSTENVESTMLKVNQGGCVKSVFSHIQSNLCQSCKEKGWTVFGRAHPGGSKSYYNLKTSEFKHSK